jgi:hypothetical protein
MRCSVCASAYRRPSAQAPACTAGTLTSRMRFPMQRMSRHRNPVAGIALVLAACRLDGNQEPRDAPAHEAGRRGHAQRQPDHAAPGYRWRRRGGYALGAHTESLGLAQSTHNALPARFQRGMFIGQHGSWNRRPRSDYKVNFMRFVDGRPSGIPLDVLTGFVDAAGNARGRPVGVAIDTKGTLLVADDVGNTVWRVTSAVPAR